jgi:hypothetical protein
MRTASAAAVYAGNTTESSSSAVTNTTAEYIITVIRLTRVNEISCRIRRCGLWRSFANAGNAMSTTTAEMMRTGSSTTSYASR